MNSRIQPYNPGAPLYPPATPHRDAPERLGPPAAQETAPARSAAAPAKAPSDVPGPLSTDEQAMIDRYFPSSPAMSLRLYGPGQKSQTLNPTALGSRLDLRA